MSRTKSLSLSLVILSLSSCSFVCYPTLRILYSTTLLYTLLYTTILPTDLNFLICRLSSFPFHDDNLQYVSQGNFVRNLKRLCESESELTHCFLTWYAEKWSPEKLCPEKWSPEAVLKKSFSVKSILGNLNDFYFY